jgi:hypothetical protein
MNVILPIAINDSNFSYSNIAEPDLSSGEASWFASTSYVLGQEVVRPNHKKYKNTLAGADAGLPEIPQTPQRWTETGVSNKWAAADNLRNTQSARCDVLIMKFTPAQLFDSIGVVGIEGNDINITVNFSGATIYSYSQSLFIRTARNWFDWAFKRFRTLNAIVRLDLPVAANAEIVVTINNVGGVAKCGGVIFGKKQYIGKIEYASSGNSLNFSKFDRDFDSSISVLIPRESKPTVDGVLSIEKEYLDDLIYAKKLLNASPTIWTGLDDDNISSYFQLFLIMGIYKNFDINALHPTHAKITLQLEEF